MMDFVTHFSWKSQGHDTVWMIVDRLTKSVHFLAMRMTFTLEEFCRLYVGRLSDFREYQYLLYRIGMAGLRLIFGRVSIEPW